MKNCNLSQNDQSISKKESGQTVIEFLLLFLVIITLSFSLMSGINRGIANIWTNTIKIVASPTDTNIELR